MIETWLAISQAMGRYGPVHSCVPSFHSRRPSNRISGGSQTRMRIRFSDPGLEKGVTIHSLLSA